VAGSGADWYCRLYLQGEPVSADHARRHRMQGGFTLIELLVASVIGLIIMTGLTSVVLTTYRASQTASNRVEAAGEIRSFEQTAYGDFAASSLPVPPVGCGSSSSPCSHDPIQLQGCMMTNSITPSPQPRLVTYTWPLGSTAVDRTIGGGSSNPAASGVTGFSWYLDGTSPNQSVVLALTVQIGALTQSQTMRFHPRVRSALPPNVSPPC
jgi:prepilin-type N-terminal cleavage/methylation domain-containing protein